MCMGCMANADFVVTSGILGAASVRVGLRRFLPAAPWRSRKVTDEEASAFMASLAPTTGDATVAISGRADAQPDSTPATAVDRLAGPTPDTVGFVDGRAEPTPTTAGVLGCRTEPASELEGSPASDASAPSQVLAAR